jgi:hypothetical protein
LFRDKVFNILSEGVLLGPSMPKNKNIFNQFLQAAVGQTKFSLSPSI